MENKQLWYWMRATLTFALILGGVSFLALSENAGLFLMVSSASVALWIFIGLIKTTLGMIFGDDK